MSRLTTSIRLQKALIYPSQSYSKISNKAVLGPFLEIQDITDAPTVHTITASTGSILIFCVGVGHIWGKTFRAANMPLSVVIAMAAAFVM